MSTTPELGCVDCGWTGRKRRFDGDKEGALYYHNQHAYECPACGSDAIPYAEWLTEKGETR
jgi:hypothetical protein